MKYGYMRYRKHLLTNKNERPMNLGDPIQSLAVLELFKRLNISDEDILPLDRYDLADYDGEEVVAVINGPETYEQYAYATRFLPISEKIYPVFIGIHLQRDFYDYELETFRKNQPIGCRDEHTVNLLMSKGIDAFLSGCLTMVFPRRDSNKIYNTVFIVDCSDSTLKHIPNEIKDNAVFLSQVIRMNSKSTDYKLTIEETEDYSYQAQKQLNRYRNEARLVITSRLHVACPCAAMGIPVVLVRDTYDVRYQFIDRFLRLYYPNDLDSIDWKNVKAEIPGAVKDRIVSLGKNMLELAILRKEFKEIYANKPQTIDYASEEEIVANNLPIKKDDNFDFCIWGVCMPNSYLLYDQIKIQYPNAHMRFAIDTYATGIYKDNIRIIHPDRMDQLLHKDTWILVVAPAAHKDAQDFLERRYNYVLINGTESMVHRLSEG